MLAGAEFRVGHPIATSYNGLVLGTDDADLDTVASVRDDMAAALGFYPFNRAYAMFLAMETEGPRFLDRLRALLPLVPE